MTDEPDTGDSLSPEEREEVDRFVNKFMDLLARAGSGSMRDRILHAWATNDLAGAEALSRTWMEVRPADVMPLLMLAETFLYGQRLSDVLDTLERAKQLDGQHPMYYRLVCLAALAADAHTAANGAMYLASERNLPESIGSDLRERAVYRANEGEIGRYPTQENMDVRWLHLLTPAWFPESPPVRLAWDEVEGKIWIYNQALLDLAVAASSSPTPLQWEDFPEAADIIRDRVPVFKEPDVACSLLEPWMCAPEEAFYLTCALTQYGYQPRSPAGLLGSDVTRLIVDVPGGRIERGAGPHGGLFPDAEKWANIDSSAALEFIARLLPPTFNGRVSLSGPDHRIATAFEWLTSGLPEEAWE